MNTKRMKTILAFSSFCIWATFLSHAQSADSVKWVSEKDNGMLWAAIRTDFHEELQPDDPVKVAPVMAYSYKYVYRVAVYQNSALVIVGHLETKDSKYPGYYSAFNYSVESHTRTAIKGAEVFSLFKFLKFASLDAKLPTDILFTWMTCTECEASQVLSAFHYDPSAPGWTLRNWENKKDIWWTTEAGPVIWSDVSASDTISFECLHGFLQDNGEVAFAIRCRAIAEPEGGKRETTDLTAKYSFSGSESKLEIMSGHNKTTILKALCEKSPKNKLCKDSSVHASRQ